MRPQFIFTQFLDDFWPNNRLAHPHFGVCFKRPCLSYRLRLSLIGRLLIPLFTIFSHQTNGNSSDYSSDYSNLKNYHSSD